MQRRSSRFRRQLSIGYASIILLLSLPAAIAIGNAYYAAEMRDSATMRQFARLQRAETLAHREAALTTAVWTYSPDSVDRRRREFLEALAALPDESTTPREAKLLTAVEHTGRAYLIHLDHLGKLQVNGSAEEIDPFFNEQLLPRRDALIEALERYEAHQSRQVGQVRRQESLAFLLMVLVPAIAFLLAIAASIWYARRFTRQLRGMYEREQKAKTRAERAIADRDELQQILAHDLRSPLNTIAMQSGLIQVSADPDEIKEQARSIELVTQHTARLMQTLLDAGKIKDGQLAVDPQPTDAAKLLGEAVRMFEAQARECTLDLTIPPDCRQVLVERERFLQVMANLLANALRFTPRGGRIMVSAEPTDDSLRVTVADTGPGIAPEHLPYVFDRYFTHSGRKAKGTGLGLYITRSIVEAHGGTIWAENVPGNGAAFHFTMPCAD